MLKWLLVFAVIGFGLWVLIVRNRKPRRDDALPKSRAMVECAHCGLHLPSDDALLSGGRVFCSEAHRLAGPR